KTPNSFWETVYSMKWILAGAGLAVTVLASLTWFNKEERGEWFSSTWGYALQVVPLLFGGVLVAGFLLGRPGHEALI
ncbi:MAG TPA: hypothetical protein DCL58_00165, partial [Synergistaceae bacterium]|nr:hypothetical protein [Synergistaceae bacterium]